MTVRYRIVVDNTTKFDGIFELEICNRLSEFESYMKEKGSISVLLDHHKPQVINNTFWINLDYHGSYVSVNLSSIKSVTIDPWE